MSYETKTVEICSEQIGTIRKLDKLGRLVLQKDFRERFGWVAGDDIEQIFLADGTILLKAVSKTEAGAK